MVECTLRSDYYSFFNQLKRRWHVWHPAFSYDMTFWCETSSWIVGWVVNTMVYKSDTYLQEFKSIQLLMNVVWTGVTLEFQFEIFAQVFFLFVSFFFRIPDLNHWNTYFDLQPQVIYEIAVLYNSQLFNIKSL